jgi:hypothetical protein
MTKKTQRKPSCTRVHLECKAAVPRGARVADDISMAIQHFGTLHLVVFL